jgi:hypothetical protein
MSMTILLETVATSLGPTPSPSRALSDSGDIQGDVVKDNAPTPMAADGGGNNGMGKSVVVEGEHAFPY